MLYQKALKLIDRNHLQTITVDLFDTILLNQYWPSDLRNYDLAAKWLPVLQKSISTQLTQYEIYTWHRLARQQLTSAGRPVRIDLWLDVMIDFLCLKYDIALDSEERLQLLATLISTEISFLIDNITPNRNLLAQLTTLQKLRPSLKIYFVADTHFTKTQINTILDILNIGIFDNGCCSSEHNIRTVNDNLYQHLSAEFSSQFQYHTNLHLGDHRIPDYLIPLAQGSRAIHYRPLRLRGYRTLIGRAAWSIIRSYQRSKHSSVIPAPEILQTWRLCLSAQLQDQHHFLTATTPTAHVNDILAEHANIQFAPINLTAIAQAFVWLLATYSTEKWDSAQLLKLLAKELCITERASLYQLCFSPDYVYSEMAINSHSDASFWQNFLTEIRSADPSYTDHLRAAYEAVFLTLPRDRYPLHIIGLPELPIKLYREFARLHGLGNAITV